MWTSRFEASKLINVREFLAEWDNDVYIQCASDPTQNAEKIADKMGVSEENVKELETVCRFVSCIFATLNFLLSVLAELILWDCASICSNF